MKVDTWRAGKSPSIFISTAFYGNVCQQSSSLSKPLYPRQKQPEVPFPLDYRISRALRPSEAAMCAEEKV